MEVLGVRGVAVVSQHGVQLGEPLQRGGDHAARPKGHNAKLARLVGLATLGGDQPKVEAGNGEACRPPNEPWDLKRAGDDLAA
jgi:hypothetical protein